MENEHKEHFSESHKGRKRANPVSRDKNFASIHTRDKPTVRKNGNEGDKIIQKSVSNDNRLSRVSEEELKSEKIPISDAILVLKAHLKEIDRVGELARAMGYTNSSCFSDLFRNHFGERPSEVIYKNKEEKAIKLLFNNPEMNCFAIAREIGKKDEYALNKFLIRRTGRPPSFFRKKQ